MGRYTAPLASGVVNDQSRPGESDISHGHPGTSRVAGAIKGGFNPVILAIGIQLLLSKWRRMRSRNLDDNQLMLTSSRKSPGSVSAISAVLASAAGLALGSMFINVTLPRPQLEGRLFDRNSGNSYKALCTHIVVTICFISAIIMV